MTLGEYLLSGHFVEATAENWESEFLQMGSYQHSLSLTFFLLFGISFTLHALGGISDYNEERAAHGEPAITVAGYLLSSRFWFESFQNWQSEFLAVGSIVVLSVFLRQKGSPQSKPVDAPHDATGE
jgi:hypothetical protein